MSGRICLVTGGIGGIGTAICRRFAREGARVVAAHVPEEAERAAEWREAQTRDGEAIETIAVDVRSFDSCREMVETVRETAGPVDVLINAAGITRDGTLRKLDAGAWKDVITTNLDGVYNVTKHVIDDMLVNAFGRIVNIASVNGRKGQFGQTNYAAAKAGIHGFTMSLAQEVARKGITVNTVSPGYVATPMVTTMREDVLEQIIEQIPVRRLGTPDEIARVVEFLADAESGFVTGANIDVNGGLWMH